MPTTWTEIFPDVDGPPVRGAPGDFQGVQRAFDVMADDSQVILDQFTAIRSHAGVSQLQGQAADAFKRFVGEVGDSLGDLPRVCHEASVIFSGHAGTLGDLQVEVGTALARAEAKWAAKRSLSANVDEANSRVATLRSQIDSLPPAGVDPNADAHSQKLDTDHNAAVQAQQQAARQLADVNTALAGIRHEWDQFRQRENDLRTTTTHNLEAIHLGDLKDPGLFQSFCKGAFDFVMAVSGLDFALDIAEAALNGDWAKVLWKLREVIDVALLVLAVVVLVVTLGAAAPFILAAILVLSAIKLGLDVYLYEMKWPNPESGEVISKTDVGMDVVGLATAGWGVKAGQGLTMVQQAQKLNALRTETNIATRSQLLRDLGMNPIHARTSGRGWNLTQITGVTAISKAKFAAKAANGVRNLVTKAVKAPAVLSNPYRSPLSTDIFKSTHDGHSAPEGTPEKIVAHLFPGSVHTNVCAAA